MTDRNIITVGGVTGARRSGRVRAILSDPDGGFTVRAMTRDVRTTRAKALADLDEMGNQFHFGHDFEAQHLAVRSVEDTRRLYPQLQTFGTSLRRNKQQIPLGRAE